MADWAPQLSRLGKPRYLAIADAIAEDIRSGKLAPSERLPPQRKLARRLDIDFTTVARGYVEAQRRGLIESRVGQGTFVRASAKRRHGPIARHPEIVDLSMNLPPEPDDPELLDRMQDGLEAIGRDLVYLMRYQGFRRRTGRQGRGIALASPSRAGSAAGSPVHRARCSSGAARYPRRAGKGRRCVAFGNAHLSRRAFDRRTVRLATRRTADGRRRHRCGRFRRRLQATCSARALSQSDAAQSDHAHDRANAAKRNHRHRAALWCRHHRRRPLWLLAGRRPAAVRGARAGHHLARRWAGQMSRRRAAYRLCRGAGCPFRLVVCVLGAHRDGDGIAGDHRARDPLDHRRYRGRAARRSASRIDGAAKVWSRRSCRAAPTAPTRSAFICGCRCRSRGRARLSSAIRARPASAWWPAMRSRPKATPPEAVRVCLGGPADRPAVRSALEFMAHALAESPTLTSTFL